MLALLFVTLPFVVRAVQPVLLELDQRDGAGGRVARREQATVFRRIILPNLTPAIIAGAGLAFARAVGEFGSLVLITGNIPFETQAASVFIFSQVESDNTVGRGGGVGGAAGRGARGAAVLRLAVEEGAAA